MQTQYSLLGFRINLYFDDYKLAIVIDELGCKFIIIDPGKKSICYFQNHQWNIQAYQTIALLLSYLN